MTEDGRQMTDVRGVEIIKSFCGCFTGTESVGQWASSMIGKRSYKPLIMAPRLHPESNENLHKRTAQQIGPPCHGAPGRRRQK
jgi:hypothetical protein